jgi:hypothetical protein
MKRSKKEVEAIVSAMGVFMAIISNLVELVKKLGGTMENIYRLATPEGNKTLEAVAQIIVNEVAVTKKEFLRLIPESQSLILDTTSGTETFSDAKDVFDYIDPDFKNWDANAPGNPTAETKVKVREMINDATFSQMFGSLCSDVRKLCLTPGQIKNFATKYRGWLRTEGYVITFFLFESKGNFFVADVYFVSDDALHGIVYQFGDGRVWDAEDHRRVVVPQLAAQTL